MMKQPGLYIVTLSNEHPISVNAHDRRIADKAIKVTHANCKFGKAKVLEGRRKNYEKTFGAEYVEFTPLAVLQDIAVAEKAILNKLNAYRIRGRTGRKNEWLEGIDPADVIAIVRETLVEIGVEYRLM
jgi:hypothetical protein